MTVFQYIKGEKFFAPMFQKTTAPMFQKTTAPMFQKTIDLLFPIDFSTKAKNRENTMQNRFLFRFEQEKDAGVGSRILRIV